MTTATLRTEAQARDIFAKAWAWTQKRVREGRAVVFSLQDETRSDAQNKLLHALIRDIAERREWAGKKQDEETWKRLLVAAWDRACGRQAVLVPALDGHGVDIVFRRTSKMTKAEVTELVQWIEAWDADA